MPIVTVTVGQPKSTAFKQGILQSMHAALVAAGVNPKDKISPRP